MSTPPQKWNFDEDYDRSKYETTTYPKWPANCTSLLRKHMSKDIWDYYLGKTDRYGASLGMIINTGVVNFDISNGTKAASPDSYEAFSKLYEPLVEDYHMFAKGRKHVSNLDASSILDLPNLDPEGKFILSSRVRAARNLAGFPFGPIISKKERLEVERIISNILESFTGELAGKYYKLETMSREEEVQLRKDHFLFQEGDRFMEAAGLNRHWPSGRGIFHNHAKTFLVWLNEEDQVRIISMQTGSNIGQVFDRFCRAARLLEEKANFVKSDRLGYLSTGPSNLGTGLRASVHLRIPLLIQDKPRFYSICEKHHVDMRGFYGDGSAKTGEIYDISNKRRLGHTEPQLVMDMYNGVKEMIAVEKELMNTQ